MPGGASQDMLLDDLFEDIYQIVMYLLWSQSVFNSNDECCVVYIVITALCNTLLSFQLLSFLWKTELPVSCQPTKPNFYPQCSQWHKALSDLAGGYRCQEPWKEASALLPQWCLCPAESRGAVWLL